MRVGDIFNHRGFICSYFWKLSWVFLSLFSSTAWSAEWNTKGNNSSGELPVSPTAAGKGKTSKERPQVLKNLYFWSISTADGKGMKIPNPVWSGGDDEAPLTQTKQGKWTKTNWGFQETNRAVNHKMYSVAVTSGIPWHHTTAIVLVRMRNDLNRNAVQPAETQNKSTGKQDKAHLWFHPAIQDQKHDLKRAKYSTFPKGL